MGGRLIYLPYNTATATFSASNVVVGELYINETTEDIGYRKNDGTLISLIKSPTNPVALVAPTIADAALTGIPTAPTAVAGTSTTQLATTAFVIANSGVATSAAKLTTARNINGVAFDGTVDITINAVDSTARLASSLLGAVNGVAGLDATGRVPSSQLPSYVDDVLEYADLTSFPITGESGKIYVAIDTTAIYRWSGSTYISITSGSGGGSVISVAGKTGVVTLVKADVGLSNVDNTSDLLKPVSTATQTAIDTRTATVTDDLTTDATMYPAFVDTVGVNSGLKVSSTSLQFNPLAGNLSSTSFSALSDEKLKTNIVTSEGLNIINQLNGVEYDWKANGNHSAGVIAQELEKILPFLVETSSEGTKSVNYAGLTGYLINSIKELSQRVAELEGK